MDSIKIKISGMGLTISEEVYQIEKFLNDIGYTNVSVIDNHKPINKLSNVNPNLNRKITIIADHQPWSG